MSIRRIAYSAPFAEWIIGARDEKGASPHCARVEVLHWIRHGKTNHEIGVILEIATATVSENVERILKKLHVENRTPAVFAFNEPSTAANGSSPRRIKLTPRS